MPCANGPSILRLSPTTNLMISLLWFVGCSPTPCLDYRLQDCASFLYSLRAGVSVLPACCSPWNILLWRISGSLSSCQHTWRTRAIPNLIVSSGGRGPTEVEKLTIHFNCKLFILGRIRKVFTEFQSNGVRGSILLFVSIPSHFQNVLRS